MPKAPNTSNNDGMTPHKGLLDIKDVMRITGLGHIVASRLIRETGHAIKTHGRLYILEDDFYEYFRNYPKLPKLEEEAE